MPKTNEGEIKLRKITIDFTIEDYTLIRQTLNELTIDNREEFKYEFDKIQSKLDRGTKINTILSDQGFITMAQVTMEEDIMDKITKILINESTKRIVNNQVLEQDDIIRIADKLTTKRILGAEIRRIQPLIYI